MRGIKPNLSISKLSVFGCTVFMRKRGRDVIKLEAKALKGKFVGYTEGDNGYLVYVPNTRKVMAVLDVIIKGSEVGSIPDNTETPHLLDGGSQQLGIWHPDDGHQDDGNREEQGTSTSIKEEWHDAESVNTQEITLRRDASDVEEAALDEKSTATRVSLRHAESLEDSETEDFSQSETVGFLKRHWSKRTGQSPDAGHKQGVSRNFLEKSRPMLVWLRVTKWNPEQFMKPSKMTIGTSGTGQWSTRSRHCKTVRLGT